MELVVAGVIGLLTAAGVWLTLRARSFDVILGLSFLSYAVNVFLFASGRLAPGRPPIVDAKGTDFSGYTDPLPQALVLTAIVISFGMTAVLVIMAIGSHLRAGSDSTDDRDAS